MHFGDFSRILLEQAERIFLFSSNEIDPLYAGYFIPEHLPGYIYLLGATEQQGTSLLGEPLIPKPPSAELVDELARSRNSP